MFDSAERLKAEGDKRPIDHIRAELYLAILTGDYDSETEGKAGGTRPPTVVTTTRRPTTEQRRAVEAAEPECERIGPGVYQWPALSAGCT
jgi:hypothetical protein